MLLNQYLKIFMQRKLLYNYKNILIMTNGASCKVLNLSNINNTKLNTDNYDRYYLSKLIKKSSTTLSIFKKTSTYSFLNKFKI